MIMKNKKGLIFKNAIFAIVAASMFIIAIGIWVDDWNTKYDSGLTYNLGGYNKLDNISDYASTSRGDLAPQSSFDSTGSGDFEGTSLRGAFSIINNIFTPFNVVFGQGGLLDSLENDLGIPSYIIITIVTLCVLSIVFALIAILTRRTQTTT